MFMLPSDPAWSRDLKMTVEWWTGPDPVQDELDAALSHMLRPKGEERPDRPAVVIIAMRFKDQGIAEEMKLRLQHRLRRPDVRMMREKRIVLLSGEAIDRASAGQDLLAIPRLRSMVLHSEGAALSRTSA